MEQNRLKTSLLVFLVFTVIAVTNVFAQYQDGSQGEGSHDHQHDEEAYHESALRRFEIVTITSLPFTAIHSYVGVRGIQMIRHNEFAPELSTADYRIIGASAVSIALFIGFWDWLHTKDKNRSEELMPTSPQRITPPRRTPIRDLGENNWDPGEPNRLVVSAVHIWF